MSIRRRFVTRASAAAIALTVAPGPARAASPVRGIFNWIHSTGNAEQAFAFYHDVFGVEGGSVVRTSTIMVPRPA